MTARWSGVSPRTKAPKAPFSRRISKQNVGGFSHGVRRAVSEERVFTAGAREQTSVVETDSKHPGGASKEGREAPRGAHRQATGRREARTGPIVILFAQGCKSSQWPQGQGEPSIETSCKSLVVKSSLCGWSPGCGSSPWKARGVSIPVSAKPARRDARPRLGEEERQFGDCRFAKVE